MQRSAFSLVELSIVLVILGLLTGGILAGQSLIRAAELRAIPTEFNRYSTARHAFRDKYFQLPGDLSNAYAFWGASCGTNATTVSTGCNGDGDGTIEEDGAENLKVWEHLSRAGIIEGSYDGTGTVSGTVAYLNSTNVPRSKFPEGVWDMTNAPQDCVGGAGCDNKLAFGAITSPTTNAVQTNPNFKVVEAWNIDMKMDDGRANTGKVRGDNADSCWDNGTDYYSIGTVGENYGWCILHFVLN